MNEAFVIIDMRNAAEWPASGPLFEHTNPLKIPEHKRPTVVQCSREIAEREALRLQQAHPDGRFVLFEATHVTVQVDAPTHVNLSGQTMFSRQIARLAKVHDADEIPF
jgi:hypothetical protein